MFEVKKIERKSLLYKSKVEFEDYAINHVSGCTHGCKYPCYARLIAKKTESEWDQISIVSNAIALLQNEIPRLKNDIKQVHLCFMTDVFMYQQPEVIKLSLDILRILKENNISYKTLTKGEMPYTDIISIEQNTKQSDLFIEPAKETKYGITITSLNEKFRSMYEPNTAPYTKRIESLKKIKEAGIKTYVYCEPFSPLVTPISQFKEFLDSISFVSEITFGSWQYNNKFQSKAPYAPYVEMFIDYCNTKSIKYKIKKELKV
jgi:DNA repair photolyase